MRAFSDFVPILFGASAIVALVQTQPIMAAPTAPEVYRIAKQITVRITGQNPGSGVIIGRQGNTYTVLTTRHVVATPDEYDIVAPDGQKYRLNYTTVKPLPGGIDLATLEFSSTVNYPIARLGSPSEVAVASAIYVAGFPSATQALSDDFIFTPGQIAQIKSKTNTPPTGYGLVYNNITQPGMSGGPVLNEAGEVIGIHGQGDRDEFGNKTGLNLAVPISMYLSLDNRFRVATPMSVQTQPQSLQPTGTPSSGSTGMATGVVEPASSQSKTDYTLVIEIDATKPDGSAWDFGTTQSRKPDPQIVIDNTRIGACKNTYTCTLNFSSKSKNWFIEVYDEDITVNDLIGTGKCTTGKPCRIGSASITIQ